MALHQTGILAVTTVASSIAYALLSFADNLGVDPLNVVERFGGAGVVGGIAFLVARHFIKRDAARDKRNDDLQDKVIEILSEHRNMSNTERKRHHEQLKEELREELTQMIGGKPPN